MGIYNDLSTRLIWAATQHFKTIDELNDCVVPYVEGLAAHLGVAPGRLEIGRFVDGKFVADSRFLPNNQRSEITFAVLVGFHLGNGEVFQPAISVTFRAAKDGLHVTVEDHEERLCGPLAGHPSPEWWQVTYVDFEGALRDRVDRLTMQISI